MPLIVIAAGGTAGHVVPALAVADELRDRGAEVVFCGTRTRAEAELVPKAGYELHHLDVRGFDRRNPLRAAGAGVRAAAAVPAALALLRRLGADAVLGGGGYVAGPVGLAAAIARVPLVLTEADSRLGLANRMLAPFARRVCLAFAIEGREGGRWLVTGRPVPRAIVAGDRQAARARLGLGSGPGADEPCLLVFGGSLGARRLNLAAAEAFGSGTEGPAVLHVAGRRDHAEVARVLDAAGRPARYRLYEYLDSLAEPLAACDLVLARAGGSIFELAAAGRPAVLVPYPHASGDHQSANARWMEEAGAAVVVADAELDAARVRELAGGLLADRGRLEQMGRAARALARPDAAARVAAEVLAAAGEAPVEPRLAPAASPAPAPAAPPAKTGDQPWRGRHMHFLGIGGAGMSGLALVAQRLGAEVSGCDRAESPYMRELREVGIEPLIGHDPSHARPGLELVASTAVPNEAPELAAARDIGAPVLRRAALLAELSALKRTIAVAGAHGKTTTTAMLAHVLAECGLDPSYLVGAELREPGGARAANARWSGGEWLVAEADESDRSFLALSPEVAIVTTVELDHHTTYASELELERAFEEFLERLPAGGTAVVWEGAGVAPPAGRPHVRYGLGEDVALGARELAPAGTGIRFELTRDGSPVCLVELPVPGAHNVLDALGALGAAQAAGCELEEAARALAGFRPAARRFELVGRANGALVFDDYAHHPAEVEATLRAARALEPARLVAVFQPHLYSRTLHLHRRLGRALALADVVVVLDVYPARELPEGRLAGVSGKLVADAAADSARGRPVWWLPEIDEARRVLAGLVGPGDLVVTLGAGDVDRLARELVAGPDAGEAASGRAGRAA